MRLIGNEADRQDVGATIPGWRMELVRCVLREEMREDGAWLYATAAAWRSVHGHFSSMRNIA